VPSVDGVIGEVGCRGQAEKQHKDLSEPRSPIIHRLYAIPWVFVATQKYQTGNESVLTLHHLKPGKAPYDFRRPDSKLAIARPPLKPRRL
jgi:hypothetical protein